MKYELDVRQTESFGYRIVCCAEIKDDKVYPIRINVNPIHTNSKP